MAQSWLWGSQIAQKNTMLSVLHVIIQIQITFEHAVLPAGMLTFDEMKLWTTKQNLLAIFPSENQVPYIGYALELMTQKLGFSLKITLHQSLLFLKRYWRKVQLHTMSAKSYPDIFLYCWIDMRTQIQSPNFRNKFYKKIFHQIERCMLRHSRYSKFYKFFW